VDLERLAAVVGLTVVAETEPMEVLLVAVVAVVLVTILELVVQVAATAERQRLLAVQVAAVQMVTAVLLMETQAAAPALALGAQVRARSVAEKIHRTVAAVEAAVDLRQLE
jgi:hypothetical protein